MMKNTGPLEGRLVLDLGQAAVGPISACYLGMMGATVVKVERPEGDYVRNLPPTMNGTSTTFIGNNLGKMDMVLNLKSESDRVLLEALIQRADVLVENFRSSEVMKRLNLGFERLKELNPKLIYVQSSAFGSKGPWTGMYSEEWITEAAGGLASATGTRDGVPELTRGESLMDWGGAMVNTVACLIGLNYRERTGRGLMINTSQLGSTVFAGVSRFVEYVVSGRKPAPMGSGAQFNVPDRAFKTQNGWLAVSVPSEKFWQNFCQAMSSHGFLPKESWATVDGRLADRETLESQLEEIFSVFDRGECYEMLRENDVPVAMEQAEKSWQEIYRSNDQVAANGMITDVPSPHWGSIVSQAPHWVFDKTPAQISHSSPALGEHNGLLEALLSQWAPQSGSELGRSVDGVRNTLVGLRVIEIGEGLPTAVCGFTLQQFGAEVIKVEDPAGDFLGRRPPYDDDTGAVYRSYSDNKSRRTIDLLSTVGQNELTALIRSADVVIVGYRPHTLQKLGIDYDSVRIINPRAIYSLITARGELGSRAFDAASELVIQIEAALNRSCGVIGEEPVRLGYDIVSVSTGLAAAQGILASLLVHSRGGEAQKVSVSMLGTAIALNQWAFVAESNPDKPVGRQIEGAVWPQDRGFSCQDGPCLIAFHGDQRELWRRVAVALGRPDLIDDRRYLDVLDKRPYVERYLNSSMEQWSMVSIEELVRHDLKGVIMPFMPIHELLDHPQIQGLGVITPVGNVQRISVAFPMQVDY